jgi:hypothetical protein
MDLRFLLHLNLNSYFFYQFYLKMLMDDGFIQFIIFEFLFPNKLLQTFLFLEFFLRL